ncbi:TlpA family protein disulfide reductase [Belliella sp. DSM 107340]|uniref:TlpA family protein disulfide reductase n=1 Tax=Belliella calami TaxID=2923436 RepID=A0ABS9UP94_9BACT|nr:TlpA family protein disulfide reductase [Belliella calami]MCH7398448.1 TlpA family protein disulfide reductase [Belliella calami]
MLKNNIVKTVLRLFLGILVIITSAVLLILLFTEVVEVKNIQVMKWLPILICAIGFYFAGLINKITKFIFTLFLLTSLLFFILLDMLHFPFFFLIGFISVLSILSTRKELSKNIRISSLTLILVIFVGYLLSQPFIIKNKGYGTDMTGINLYNATVLWDFTTKPSRTLPKEFFKDYDENEVRFGDFKGKTIYVSFWATWCGPCMQQKPHLENLKQQLKDYTDIVFIDVSIDTDLEKWKNYLLSNEQVGHQLISQNIAKTHSNYQFSGIPYHIVIDSMGNFKQIAGPHALGYDSDLLSDSKRLTDFMNTPYKVFKINNIAGKDTIIRVR